MCDNDLKAMPVNCENLPYLENPNVGIKQVPILPNETVIEYCYLDVTLSYLIKNDEIEIDCIYIGNQCLDDVISEKAKNDLQELLTEKYENGKV